MTDLINLLWDIKIEYCTKHWMDAMCIQFFNYY